VIFPRARETGLATKAAVLARAVSASISISAEALQRLGIDVIRERYGNLFDMYHEITHENA